MSAESEKHLKYIKEHLIWEILSKLPEDETFVSYGAEHAGGLDGFMSALYNINLVTATPGDADKATTTERTLIVKFMKGDVTFRERSKAYIGFANEIFIYGTVLPSYEKLLRDLNISTPDVQQWIAPTYVAKFGYIDGLSATPASPESVLVLEHLKSHGYKLGPRLVLNKEQLTAMCKPLGEYHALSFALRLQNSALLDRLKSGILPMPFINDNDPNDVNNNYYRVLYRVAFDRFYEFFDRCIDSNTFDQQSEEDLKLIERLRHLRTKYFDEPTRLLERYRTDVEVREEDSRFAAILHGDYNRNNVLFRFKQVADADANAFGPVEDVKMIDFQELRYGTPCIDLSFFLFFNSSNKERPTIWNELLKLYHKNMYDTLTFILRASSNNDDIEQKLQLYSFENFNAHFSRFAFYGVMICMHFLPWILCSEKECEQISKLFETDIHGEEFRKLSITAGGDEVNRYILEVIRFACKMGYMDNI